MIADDYIREQVVSSAIRKRAIELRKLDKSLSLAAAVHQAKREILGGKT